MNLDVVTFKWNQPGFRTKYTAQHVNDLYKMLKLNSTVPFRFNCVTDDPDGLDPEIRTHKLWENPCPHYGLDDAWKPNCFARLKMFSGEMKEVFHDRIIWVDLDVVVVGNVDHILKTTDPFKIWYVDDEWSKCNGSLVAFRNGARQYLWDKFDPSKVDSKNGYRDIGFIGSDQAWIAQNLCDHDQYFGRKDGVYSYRCHLKGKPLPPDACLVFFHGDWKAADLWNIPWIRRSGESLQTNQPLTLYPTRSKPERDTLRVVTWLWKPKHGKKREFGAECVNTALAMVDRYYKRRYEFVCITDDPTGLDGSIRTIPLWKELSEVPNPMDSDPTVGTCYPRLKMYSPEMADIIAPRFVSVDLDMVMIRDVTDLWDRKEDFVAWNGGNVWAPYQGSMTLLRAGTRSKVWTGFDPRETPLRAKEAGFVGTDQAAVAYLLGKGEATWTAERDGVYDFRRLGYTESGRPGKREPKVTRRPRVPDVFGAAAEREVRMEARRIERRSLPANCKIVFFPGHIRPWHELAWRYFPWISKNYKEIGGPSE